MYTNDLDALIQLALREDFAPCGDITSDAIFLTKKTGSFDVNARQAGICSSTELVSRVYKLIDPEININFFVNNSERFDKDSRLATIHGDIKNILYGERLFLNLWQRAISIASYTNKFVELIKHTDCKILETRKTTPGLRILEKKAVLDGGGTNHRYNLSTGILIKDNHIKMAGNITNAIVLAISHQPYLTKIEVEVDNLDQFFVAINYPIDRVLLDNFSIEDTQKAVNLIKQQKKSITLESSGSINLNTVKNYAESGVDFISIGSLTQSIPLIDIGLD